MMETDLKMGANKIREHCDFVRNEVEVKIESWHKYIDKFHADFKNTIDGYEKECLVKYENKKSPTLICRGLLFFKII